MLTKCRLKSRLNTVAVLLTGLFMGFSSLASAAHYNIDVEGAHAFIQFRIKHLGYSWLWGRFDQFDGHFTFDPAKPEATSISVKIDMKSLNSNHAERDKHLRNEDFFDVAQFPTTTFVSQSVTMTSDTTAKLTGTLTLKGVSKAVEIEVEKIGGGPDPWGGYRQGFEGTTTIVLKDFGIDYNLGPASTTAEVFLSIEGIRERQETKSQKK